MTNVDQFESVFRSAAKERFVLRAIELRRILVVTDLDEGPAATVTAGVRQLLDAVVPGSTWRTITASDYATVEQVLALIEAEKADLVCTYRHLHSGGNRQPYTLGDHVEVLTQRATAPVLVMPHPQAGHAAHAMRDTSLVMAITDHLTGDHRLVSYAVALTQPGGRLSLSHVEDEGVYRRYMEVISKIETIDTEEAAVRIRGQLLKEPADYIESCREVLIDAGVDVTVDAHVLMGRRLATYRRLIDEHAVDLLVMNTRDGEQLAMHGLAYPLAVELRAIPILML